MAAILPASSLNSTAAAVASAATTLVIGTSNQYWNAIPSSPSSYSIETGTVLSFRYNTGHNVWLVPSVAAYDGCDFSGATELSGLAVGGGQAPYWPNQYQTVATQPGELLIVCAAALGSHCARGQKIRVTVSPPSPPPDSNPCFGRDMFACRVVD
eukprot:5578864-Prymnesium_polylepis.1